MKKSIVNRHASVPMAKGINVKADVTLHNLSNAFLVINPGTVTCTCSKFLNLGTASNELAALHPSRSWRSSRTACAVTAETLTATTAFAIATGCDKLDVGGLYTNDNAGAVLVSGC